MNIQTQWNLIDRILNKEKKITYMFEEFIIENLCYLTQTASGNVEAKVVCFYRRRDIPSSLIQLADKHASKFLIILGSANIKKFHICGTGKTLVNYYQLIDHHYIVRKHTFEKLKVYRISVGYIALQNVIQTQNYQQVVH